MKCSWDFVSKSEVLQGILMTVKGSLKLKFHLSFETLSNLLTKLTKVFTDGIFQSEIRELGKNASKAPWKLHIIVIVVYNDQESFFLFQIISLQTLRSSPELNLFCKKRIQGKTLKNPCYLYTNKCIRAVYMVPLWQDDMTVRQDHFANWCIEISHIHDLTIEYYSLPHRLW